MLISGQDLDNSPILSLQTGSELARVNSTIINPHNLSIIAFEVSGPNLDQTPSVLRVQDIRELSPIGIIIDSSEEFVQPDDIIKLKEIYDMQFRLEGKHVLDENRDKLGKIIEYNLETNSFVIQQLAVKRPLLKSFNDSELLVHRSQVIEVSDDAIVIKSKASNGALKSIHKEGQTYVNPFRKSSPQAEAIRTQKD